MTGKADFTEEEWETVLEGPTKASPEELEDYKRFTLSLAERVAGAKKEGDQPVSDAERAAIDEISVALSQGPG
jgi:hypothetical protein